MGRVSPAVGKGRIAFVPPRYGDDVVGGAESVLRQAAERLAGRGWEVDVLTTCARDHFTWANVYPPGSERHGDLTVMRFPVVHPRDSTGWQELDRRIRLGASVSTAEQRLWVNGRFRVPEPLPPSRGFRPHLPGHRLLPLPLLDDDDRRHCGSGADGGDPLPPRRVLRLSPGVPFAAGRLRPGVVHVGARAPAGPPDRSADRHPPRYG